MEGTLIDAPFWASNKEQITVHPLGGTIMSSDGAGRNGAVDHMGRVYVGEKTKVHHGLLCFDAAVILTVLGEHRSVLVIHELMLIEA
jgi:hypothetical protein